ncbi:MAG: type I restriction enzyme HsdR N-terminal domain-containing protein [Bacteroidales bacterium]
MRSLVFDPVRKKKVVLTPEEGVRQQLIDLLHNRLGYPINLMVCEYSMSIGGLKYRGDLVLMNKELKPLLLAECKAPSIKVTKETFEQIMRYNMALNVKHLLLTNGVTTYFASFDRCSNNYKYLTEIPSYNELPE